MIFSLLILSSLLILALVGIFTERSLMIRDKQRFPPRGQLIKAAGENVHVEMHGSKGPTVVFLAGLGNSVLTFSWIVPLIQHHCKTIAFERPGFGWSETNKKGLDAGHSAEVLAATLDSLAITEPVILVAHSYGGIVARLFATHHPERVAGLILIDTSHEDQLTRLPNWVGKIASLMMFQNHLQKWRARFGLMRTPSALTSQGKGLPENDQAAFTALLATYQHRKAASQEASAWSLSREQAQTARDFGDKPLVVFASTEWPAVMKPVWIELQREIASWSNQGKLIVVDKSNHVTIAFSETHGKTIALTILDMVSNLCLHR